MPYSRLHHPYRIDAPTLAAAATLPGAAELAVMPHSPYDIRLMAFSPTVFTHAYQLLGEAPQRFGQDLSLYLASTKTFFERADVAGGIDLTGFGNSDSLRRLSEDLGVAFASLFMVKVFGVLWETIAQIPSNTKLSTKRPDFVSFNAGGDRYLYEAKGTTGLDSIESSMTRALGQVKTYPEQAERKIAIVTYLCRDNRFFPSASFVVDPPAFPEAVPATLETAKLLHLEKVIQFLGLFETAKRYVSALSLMLRERRKAELQERDWQPSEKLIGLKNEIATVMAEERQRLQIEEVEINQTRYLIRFDRPEESTLNTQRGVATTTINHALNLEIGDERFEDYEKEESGLWLSSFNDGTVLKIFG
jgi:hypothetical protein